ncbi:uncharacterized protein [Vicugna pacos]|uniref:Uncharacterized protein n=1 Tax=Vicugna pacos TaxID=30538 RepID=A0ABM5E123_VICPA
MCTLKKYRPTLLMRWRIQQLLLLPLLFRLLPRLEAAGSGFRGTSALPALLRLFCCFPSVGTPLPCVTFHLEQTPAPFRHLHEKPWRNLPLPNPQVWPPGVPGSWPLSGKLLLQPGSIPTPCLPLPWRLPSCFLSARTASTAQPPHVPHLELFPHPRSFLGSTSPPPQRVSCLRGRPCILIGAVSYVQELPTTPASGTTSPHRSLRDSGWAGFRTTPGSSRVLPASPE